MTTPTVRIQAGASGDDPAFLCGVLSDAVAMRFGQGYRPHEAARQYVDCSLHEMACALTGQPLRRDGGRWLAQAMQAGQPGADFPDLLSNAGEKILEAARQAAPPALRAVAAKRKLRNFKATSFAQPGDFPALQPVGENGEVTVGTMGDRAETAQLATFARDLGLTRQAIISDDLHAFADMANAAGRAAAALEGDKLAAAITANPTMADNVTVFHASHGNLAASGSALSLVSVGAGRAAMRAQASTGGAQTLNIPPAFVVVPSALETVAEETVASVALAPGGKMQIVTEPRLDVASATAWYLAADSALLPCLAYGYLGDAEGAQVKPVRRRGFDGVTFRATLDLAVFWIDWKGVYRNPGA